MKSGNWTRIETLPHDPDAIDIAAIKRAQDLATWRRCQVPVKSGWRAWIGGWGA